MVDGEQHAVDGSLIFDTEIDKKGFEQDMKSLESIAEQKKIVVKAEVEMEKTDFERDKARLEREVQEGLGETEAESKIDKSGFEADKKALERHIEAGTKPIETDTVVDDAGLKKGIAQLDETAKRAMNQLDSPIDGGELTIDTRVSQSSSRIGAGSIALGGLGANFLQAGINKLIETGQKGIQLASDLEEVQNVVDVTFGEGAAQIEQFAQTAKSSFGLAELQTKQYSGTLGAMMKSMGVSEGAVLDMSTSLTGLIGDMASFYNLDHDAMFEKIRSGIAGEVEPLRALGINMSVANLEAYALTKGLKKAYDQMTEAEKVQLRYEYIMEQTADAQGDFVRTQDSYANQVRVLQNNLDTMAANIGTMLIPMLTSATSWVNSLFAGPEVNETQAAIDEAAATLKNLQGDIDAINGSYTADTIAARVEYRQAMGLSDEFGELLKASDKGYGDRVLRLGMSGDDVTALQNQLVSLGYAIDMAKEVGVFGRTTEEALKAYQTDMELVADGIAGVKTYASLSAADTEKLRGVTEELVAIYPELAQYVGEDGVLMLEKGQVDELCESYRDLKIEKLAAARVEQIGGAYADALLAQEQLKVIRDQEEQARGEALKRQSAMRGARTGTGDIISRLNAGDWAAAADAVRAINSYDLAGGDLAAAVSKAAEANADVAALFENGALRTNLSTDSELLALMELLLEVQGRARSEEQNLQTQIEASSARLEQLDAEITEGEKSVNQAYEAWKTAEEALKRMGEDGAKAGTDTGQSIADALSAEQGTITGAVADIAKAAQTEAAKHPITFSTQIKGASIGKSIINGSHATGLNYVPYDNYLARLHVGEAVLTASEAQTWRSQQQGIDYGALAAAVRASGSTSADNRPIQIVLDGKVLAEATADRNRTAINDRSRRLEMGRGK